MRAVVRHRYGSPDVLRVEEVQVPAPRGDQVLVRVRAASVNTADLDHLYGRPRAARLATGLRRPRTERVGLDLAGTVEAVGPQARRLRPGDEVWADLFGFGHGSFADYVSAPERAFAVKPPGLSFTEAATVPHSAVLALQGILARGPIRPGERVLVNGAGGCVGPFAVQIARAKGAEVTAVDHTGKLEMLRALGADHVVDYTAEDFTQNGRRYHLILDIAASRSVLGFRRSLTGDGRYALIARSLSGFVQAALLGRLVSKRGGRRMGVFVWVPNRSEDLETLASLILSGKVSPVIDRSFPLEEAAEALRYLESGRARGKVLLLPGGQG